MDTPVPPKPPLFIILHLFKAEWSFFRPLLIKNLYLYGQKNHLNEKIYEVVVYVFSVFGQTGSSSKGPPHLQLQVPRSEKFLVKISMFLTEMKLQLKGQICFFFHLIFYTSKRPKDPRLKLGFWYSDDFIWTILESLILRVFLAPIQKRFASKMSSFIFLYDHFMT